jgi:hypothetical protein
MTVVAIESGIDIREYCPTGSLQQLVERQGFPFPLLGCNSRRVQGRSTSLRLNSKLIPEDYG